MKEPYSKGSQHPRQTSSSSYSKSQKCSPLGTHYHRAMAAARRFRGERDRFLPAFLRCQATLGEGSCSLLPVLNPRSQLSPTGGGNPHTPTSGRCLLRGRSRETSGNAGEPCPFLGQSKHRAKGLSRLGHGGLVTGLAAVRGLFPPNTSSGLWGGGARPEPAAPRSGRSHTSLPSPRAFPPAGPGLRPGLRDHPNRRPDTPSGSLRRSPPADSQASVAAVAILTILSLGSAQLPQPPPPSSSDSSTTRPPRPHNQ